MLCLYQATLHRVVLVKSNLRNSVHNVSAPWAIVCWCEFSSGVFLVISRVSMFKHLQSTAVSQTPERVALWNLQTASLNAGVLVAFSTSLYLISRCQGWATWKTMMIVKMIVAQYLPLVVKLAALRVISLFSCNLFPLKTSPPSSLSNMHCVAHGQCSLSPLVK